MDANISEQSGKKPFKNGCIDKDGEKRVSSTFQTIEKRALFYVNFCHFHRPFKHSNFGLRNADVDYHTHSICFIALHMVRMLRVCVCVRSFFPSVSTHFTVFYLLFILRTHAPTLCLLDINGVNECEKGKTSFLMRCDDINICSVRFLVFFFSLHSVETLFNVPTSIYVIVIIWNRIRGEIRNIK